MLKIFNDFAKAEFASRMAKQVPEFRPKRSLRGPLAGALNFEFRNSSDKCAWISFGGFKEKNFAVLAAWTVSGKELRSLSEWEQYGNPRAFEVPPIPADGYVDLRDRWRFENGGQEAGTWHSIDIIDPPHELATRVYEEFTQSQDCRLAIDRQYAGALRLYTKNPPSPEQHRKEFLEAERVYCSLWSHLATRHAFTDAELQEYLGPVVSTAIELVVRYGVPLIAGRLAASTV